MTTKAVLVRVYGRVQGVGYRNWTRNAAHSLSLAGWVKNCEDGSVELVAQGLASAIDELITRLWKGPNLSRVKNIEVSEIKIDSEIQAFSIKS